MKQELYELIALFMRHVFWIMMLLIVVRAIRITMIDAQRAAKLRRLSPMTGICGELLVLEGDERARKGMRYPVIREGMIGTSRNADIRIRHSSLRRRHAYFQLTEDGLHLRGHAGAKLRNSQGKLVRELTLADGDDIGIGKVHLLLILTEATGAAEIRLVDRKTEPVSERYDENDDWADDFADAPKRIRFDDFESPEPPERRVEPGISRTDPDALFRVRPTQIRENHRDPFDDPFDPNNDPYDSGDPFDGFESSEPPIRRKTSASQPFDPYDAPMVRKKAANSRENEDLFELDDEEDW